MPISSIARMPVSTGGWCIARTVGVVSSASRSATQARRSSSSAPPSVPGTVVSQPTTRSDPTRAAHRVSVPNAAASASASSWLPAITWIGMVSGASSSRARSYSSRVPFSAMSPVIDHGRQRRCELRRSRDRGGHSPGALDVVRPDADMQIRQLPEQVHGGAHYMDATTGSDRFVTRRGRSASFGGLSVGQSALLGKTGSDPVYSAVARVGRDMGQTPCRTPRANRRFTHSPIGAVPAIPL